MTAPAEFIRRHRPAGRATHCPRMHAILRPLALVATALALGPALAHLFALPNKIALPREAYFVAQSAYRGWNLLGIVLLVQVASLVALAVTARADARARRAALLALLAVAGAQAVFWAFTFPANQATDNWTSIPAAWEALRLQWEYSHAAGAALQLAAIVVLAVGLASPRTDP